MKRYYMAMTMHKTGKYLDETGKIKLIQLNEKEIGIVGMIPVFTNKAKAAKWGRVVEIELEDKK